MKKTIILLSLMFLFPVILFTQENPNTPQGFYDKYYIGAMDLGNVTGEDGWNQYKDLGFNLWHAYPRHCGWQPRFNNGWTNWVANDMLDENISNYGQGIIDVLGFCYSKNLRVLMDRVKIDFLCYGQRSNYQCEEVPANSDLWFYAYNEHDKGRDITDNSRIVRYCEPMPTGPDGPGWVVKNLKANREQVNCRGFSHPFMQDQLHRWHVKPCIKIPIGLPDETEVCRVDVYNWYGEGNVNNRIASVVIKAKNFKNISTTYNGEYIEEFYWNPLTNDPPSAIIIDPAQTPFNQNCKSVIDLGCQVDFRVWYSGQCEMWIDYVRVDNQIAHDLFSGQHDDWIHWEVQDIAMHDQTTKNTALKFYIEEFEFNNIPCMSYVARKIREYSDNRFNLMCDMNNGEAFMIQMPNWWEHLGQITPAYMKRYLVDSVGLNEFFTFSYPFMAYRSTGYINQYDLENPPQPFMAYVPNTLLLNNYSPVDGRLGQPTDPITYENWLQGWIDNPEPYDERFTTRMKLADNVSKLCDIPFVNLVQTHLQYNGQDPEGWQSREPTNEELAMMVNLSVTYGAKGQLYYAYQGWGPMTDPGNFSRGLVDGSDYCNDNNYVTPRHENAYGQLAYQNSSKFDAVKKINQKLIAWGPYLMKFNNDDRHSFRFYDVTERAQSYYYTKILDILTYPSINCISLSPGPLEDVNSRYIQIADFTPEMLSTSDFNERYFMIVNRRCSPHTPNDCGGLRNIQIKFCDFNFPAGTGFLMFRNLNLIDLETGAIVKTFDKYDNGAFPIIDLGWFEPGEAKLYKLAPTLLTGGTLVADEDILYYEGLTTGNYDVTNTVYNNGHNIYIEGMLTFNFAENTGFILNGGQFLIGETGFTNFIGKNCQRWNGISISNCSNFTSIGVNIKDIKDNTYGLSITNSAYTNLGYTNFDYTNGNINAGGVNINSSLSSNPPIYIWESNYNMGTSSMQAVNIVSSPYSCRLGMGNININSSYTGLSSGMFLSGCTGRIEYSNINGPIQGIIAVNSNIDLYHNQIYNSSPGGESIYGTAYSYLNMAPSRSVLLAGVNSFSQGKRNVIILNSRFNLLNGNNSLFITGSYDDKHLLGYVPVEEEAEQIDVTGNCFYTAGNASNPLSFITRGSGGPQINVVYWGGNNCNITEDGIAFIVDPNTNYADTVYRSLTFQNESHGEDDALQQNISLFSWKHEHDSVIVNATIFLNNYPDSAGCTEAVEEIFFSSLALDNNGNKMGPLKSYFETLILNNPNNISLINILFYYIQKCKASLGEFVTAMGGFQQIINQNPYTYEGLIASWDYMSTYLLDSMLGHGGGYNENNNINTPGSFENSEIVLIDDFDNVKFNDDDKTLIKQNIEKALINTKKKQTDEIVVLREKASNDDIDAIDKLKIKEVLKEAVKVQKPRNISEYIDIVNKDIKKVFNIGNSDNSAIKKQTNIPMVFRLSQNYPNPFNPVTKIKYEIPKDSKVKLVIYDLLGREVKTLVNNEIKSAGYYTIEFNMQNYASGVYFYRIEADDVKGNKFVDAKKMVLVK
jgi:hypothetical protein